MARGSLLLVNINPRSTTVRGCDAIASALRALAPALPIVLRHWPAVDAGSLRTLRPRGVVLGPNDTPFAAYPREFDDFLAWVRRRRGPTLGICGGHQALALAHGAPIGPVHPVAAATRSYRGMPKVSGSMPIRLLGDPDPLLAGLPDEIVLACSHVDEVKEVPPGFRLLAIGDPCHVQIIRADRLPIYGIQGHPERPAPGDAGLRLLQNWLRML